MVCIAAAHAQIPLIFSKGILGPSATGDVDVYSYLVQHNLET